MGPDSTADREPGTTAPTSRLPGPGERYAPLPPSRRQRDTNTQWVVALIAVAAVVLATVLVLAFKPSGRSVPSLREPVRTEQTCSDSYLACDDGPTGWPR